jgi:hypothetical protein
MRPGKPFHRVLGIGYRVLLCQWKTIYSLLFNNQYSIAKPNGLELFEDVSLHQR